MLLQPMSKSDGLDRAFAADLMDLRERVGTLTTVGAGTILAALFANSILARSGPVGGFTDTTDSAANIVAAVSGNGSLVTAGVTFEDFYQPAGTPTPGATWRWLYINTVAQAMTLAAGTGVTLGTNVNVAASLWREYLLTLTNTTAPQTFSCTTVSGSTAVTFADSRNLKKVTAGMLVTGVPISGGTTVAAMTSTGVTLSAVATASGVNNLSFSPTLTIQGLRSGTA